MKLLKEYFPIPLILFGGIMADISRHAFEDISGGETTFIGNSTYGLSFARSAQAHDFWGGVGMSYLDSPSTTSAVTYQVQASNAGGSSNFQISVNSTSTSNIFALEIAA